MSYKKAEEMASFFKVRADGYDNHMKDNVNQFDDFYNKISDSIELTENQIEILDLGCGTGIELESIFKKAPHANITGIDITKEMLDILLEKYKNFSTQITIIQDSYITYSFQEKKYDYVVSVMTMHHWLEEDKINLYRKIKNSLKDGGKYIEGDYVVNEKDEKELLEEYFHQLNDLEENSIYHIDIPMTIEHQLYIFKMAGFSKVDLISQGEANVIFAAS